MLSRELIVAAKARADAATVGPWRHIETPYGESVEVDDMRMLAAQRDEGSGPTERSTT